MGMCGILKHLPVGQNFWNSCIPYVLLVADTRLFHSGVDEQSIMSSTGHRSLEGVRAYKRVSDDQKEQVSTVLNDTINVTIETT